MNLFSMIDCLLTPSRHFGFGLAQPVGLSLDGDVTLLGSASFLPNASRNFTEAGGLT
jgi:hypothetical protein